MIKLITPGSYDFGEMTTELVRISSRGIIGHDKKAFLKRASAGLLHKVADLKLASGEVPVHVIALGATENFGPNRNGDGFRRDVCARYHDTFTKFAHWFRHHQNKDTSKGRGTVKLSAFNEDLGRIELIVALNATKEAAARNKGLVADVEMEKLARGEDIPTSMGTHVSHDICSGCSNKARYRSEYCDDSICHKYGGLKRYMGRTYEDGHTLHADNPDPQFFDISLVGRNADRISFGLGALDGYEKMLKAASTGHIKMSGAAWAESMGVTTPSWLYTDAASPWAPAHLIRQLKIAGDLIAAEDRLQQRGIELASPLSPAFAVRTEAKDMPSLAHGTKLASVMTALHSRHCFLPLDEFLSLLSGEPATKLAAQTAQVSAALPGVFNRLVSLPDFEQRLQHNPYWGQMAAPSSLQLWAEKHAADWSLEQDRVVERLQRAVIRQIPARTPMLKAASYSASSEELANEYGLYALAFLASQPSDASLASMQELVVQGNYWQ